ncbi:MAG: hypothetical protein AAF485_09420 [Chloroflexota bacterium]
MSHDLTVQSKQIERIPWGLIFTTAIGLAAYLGMAILDYQQGTLRDGNVPYTLGWYAIAFVGYLLAIIWVETEHKSPVILIWGAAILFRLLLLFTVPTLSDDVYRYIWDGYVANNGVSPYAHAIDSPELDYLDVPIRALANNRWMASPYLPTAQWLFFSLTGILPRSPLFFQIAMVVFDLLAALLIAKLLALVKQPDYRILIYLWNPLIVVEVAHGAHVDALMAFLALLAIWLTFSPNKEKKRLYHWLAPIALALATLTKILPAFLLTVLFWRWSWRQLFLYGALVISLMLPYGFTAGWGLTGPLDGTGVFGAIRIYADQWNFNSGLFYWLVNEQLADLDIDEPLDRAKQIVSLGLLLVLGAVWIIAYKQSTILAALRLMAIPYMTYLLFTTTVHPWYALVLLIFLPFLAPQPKVESLWRWLFLLPWLYLSATLAISYITYINPARFGEWPWVRKVEWIPTWGLVGLSLMIGLIGVVTKRWEARKLGN